MKYQPWTLNPFPSETLKHVPFALPWHLRQLRKGLEHRVRHWAVPSSKVWMALLHGQKRQGDRKQVWDCGETLGKAEGWMTHTLAYSPATRESWHSFAHEFFCRCGYFHMKLNSIMTHKRGSSDAYKLISHFVGILIPRCLADSWRWKGACCPSTEGGAPESPECCFSMKKSWWFCFQRRSMSVFGGFETAHFKRSSASHSPK